MNMISKSVKLVTLLALGATAPLAFGLTTTEAYIKSYSGRTDIPVPVKVVEPLADRSLVGAEAQVEFLVDASGVPHDIEILSATNARFAANVTEAVSHWKFAPAKSNGVAVPTKVVLPLVVSESE